MSQECLFLGGFLLFFFSEHKRCGPKKLHCTYQGHGRLTGQFVVGDDDISA